MKYIGYLFFAHIRNIEETNKKKELIFGKIRRKKDDGKRPESVWTCVVARLCWDHGPDASIELLGLLGEPTSLPNQQPKRRRLKDLAKSPGGSGDGPNPSEQVKIGNKGRKAAWMIERNSTSEWHRVPIPNVQGEEVQFQALTSAPEVSSKKKTADTKTAG
ncbi:HUN domain-containing protein [Forsythia ovata]|uniref:HUN domain-containing protein n=1 Tax=Forsythia ovata TaxID=205694 RepID=A0ABD1VP90_9LAMI